MLCIVSSGLCNVYLGKKKCENKKDMYFFKGFGYNITQ